MGMTTNMKLYVLNGFDPDTGGATHPVAVLAGSANHGAVIVALKGEDSEPWIERITTDHLADPTFNWDHHGDAFLADLASVQFAAEPYDGAIEDPNDPWNEAIAAALDMRDADTLAAVVGTH